ncbi:hypothetical protein PF006_g22499 [Phytophthora fragariae]|uniref:Uncharacterized protein n=1 Tax=Phytophthora fragariae TaxID=53985 RepID=A0A6A3RS45_9STRA|nr:hypothetical protein PF006_g22499 [Phytophthora fragariae]
MDEDRPADSERAPNIPQADNSSPASAMFEALTVELQARDEERGRELKSGHDSEDKMREGVAQQLVLAAAGLDAIGEKSWTAVDDTPLQRSRTRRRFEKRVRKANAKEKRELQAALAELTQPALAYKAAVEVYRRYGAEAGRV